MWTIPGLFLKKSSIISTPSSLPSSLRSWPSAWPPTCRVCGAASGQGRGRRRTCTAWPTWWRWALGGATWCHTWGDHGRSLWTLDGFLDGFIWYFVGFIYGFVYGYIYIYTYHIVYIYTLNIVWIYAILADFTSIHDDLWIYDDLWWSVMVFGSIDFTSNIDNYWSHM